MNWWRKLVAVLACVAFAVGVWAEGRSAKWPEVRALHLSREWWCASCGCEDDLEVHHIKPFHSVPELELDDGKDGTGRDGNLITLCRHCHWRVGHLRINWSDSNPDIRLILDGVGQRIYEARQARLREIEAAKTNRIETLPLVPTNAAATP